MQELSLNVLDIAQNSIAANASEIKVLIHFETDKKTLTITIKDNGKGMSEEQVENVTNPFFTTRTTRKVGMGIPLFKMAAEMCGGSFCIKSVLGEGTVISGLFKTDNIDFVPLGDISSTMTTLICLNEDRNFIYTYSVDNREFTAQTVEFKEALGEDISLNLPEITSWIEGYLKEQTESLWKSPSENN